MLTKEELKDHNKSFWQELHKRMRPIKSSNGRSISWLNYPSDVKSVHIRMEVDKVSASLNYDIQFKDAEVKAIVWEQLTEMKVVMETTMGVKADWQESYYNATGQEFGRIQWKLNGVNHFRAEDHEKIYEFLQTTLIQFDKFYQEYKEIVINLVQ
ncbi:MAG: hypothetical protein ACI9XP_001950 [Lentimonas sp.]|jgi:hypothetical protein